MVVVLDVTGDAVAAAAVALGTTPALGDERCILYCFAVATRHQYVKVTHGDVTAFARLRPAADDGQHGERSTVSFGLWEALQLSDPAETTVVKLQVDADFGDEDPVVASAGTRARCACKCGELASVEVRFLTRTRPPRAVARALQRVASSLLRGSVMWNELRSSVSWLNCRDSVRFVGISWDTKGTGCCQHIGVVSSSTRIELHFTDDTRISRAVSASQSFQDVGVYVAQIAQELGGVDVHAKKLLQAILHRLSPDCTIPTSTEPSVGALVCGLPGVGKTALVQVICKSLGVTTIFLNAADVFQTFLGQSEEYLVKTFERAVLQSPSILVIDGIEAIAGSRRALANSQSALEIGVLAALLSSVEKLKASTQRVFVLGTTTHPEDVDAAVLSNGRLDLIVKIDPPAQRERLEVLEIMTRSWRTEELDAVFLRQLSDSTGGFVGADLLSLCQKALQLCLNDSAASTATSSNQPVVCARHFEKALATTYPSVLQTHHVSHKQHQSDIISIQKDSETDAFAGVYGMADAIETLKVSLLEPLEDCSRFLAFGTTPPKGVLLTGPPGSGKTHLTQAIAEDVRRRGLASFVSVQCSDLLTKVVGDTEKALRELFATARDAAPCVLYFDQIESIAPPRGFDTSTEQTFDRMLSMLLVEMDGFNTSRATLQRSLTSREARAAFLKQHVVILASTTDKELLDPAILRPGRFDVHIHVDFPDEDARCAIITDALRKIPVNYSQDETLDSSDALARFVARHTGGMSAGDVSAILREAAMASMRSDLSATSVAIQHVKRALTEATSSSAAAATAIGATLGLRRTTGNTGSTRFRRDYAMRGARRRPTPPLGASLHERNRYKQHPPDFFALGERYPSFRQYLRSVDTERRRASLPWDDPYAVRELTKTLLLHDFGLQWDIPINRLCPPLPNRLNYLHWVEDLLGQADVDHFFGSKPDAVTQGSGEAVAPSTITISGIDVGTGANCIYALLGAAMNKWQFIATEINSESYACARENVARNKLQQLITVKHTHTSHLLREPLQDETPERQFHFVICNPPFFEDMSEADTNPDTCCMGSSSEMVCPGGEVAFIGSMIEESVELRDRVLWFTSLVGRKASLRKLLALLRSKQVTSMRTTEFCQGRTKRWGIAWTFASHVAPDASMKVLGKRKEAHRRQDLSFHVLRRSQEDPAGCESIEEVAERIREYVDSKTGLEFSAEVVQSSQRDQDKHEWMEYCLQQQPSKDGDNSSAQAFSGRVEISKRESAAEGYEVLISFEDGDRAAFWKNAEALQAATVRTSRQWRRKIQRGAYTQ